MISFVRMSLKPKFVISAIPMKLSYSIMFCNIVIIPKSHVIIKHF